MKKWKDNQQLVVSTELLHLLEWLVTYEQETLKKLVSKALNDGLHKTFSTDSHNQQEYSLDDQLQQNIIDFFGLLESLLVEALHEQETALAAQNTLFPAAKQIDASTLDNSTLNLMIAKAAQAIKLGRSTSPKDALCKELIKHWKPHKKPTLN